MGQLQERMRADLALAGYSPATCAQYLRSARQYTKHFMRPPEEMGEDEVRAYLLHLINERKLSCETIDVARAALKFLYATTLRRPIVVEHLPVMRHPRRLPEVLSGTEVSSLLEAVTRQKYRALLMALYAGGLRVSEGCRLRPEDIDSRRMLIHVREGKGGRDRYTLLSTRLLHYLRDYYRACRPKEWLFPSRTRTGYASRKTVSKVLAQALAKSGIKKHVSAHTLRHSFATHLLECGVDVIVIRALLGHGSVRVTELYTRVSLEHIGRVKSPLDVLGTEEATVLG
jgi:integrase/recombinase XerD